MANVLFVSNNAIVAFSPEGRVNGGDLTYEIVDVSKAQLDVIAVHEKPRRPDTVYELGSLTGSALARSQT